MTKITVPPSTLEVVAGNGLLHRRLFLTQGAALAGSLTLLGARSMFGIPQQLTRGRNREMRRSSDRKWTVMVVPHGSGSSRAVEVSQAVLKTFVGIGSVLVLLLLVLGGAALSRGVTITRSRMLERENRLLADEIQRMRSRLAGLHDTLSAFSTKAQELQVLAGLAPTDPAVAQDRSTLAFLVDAYDEDGPDDDRRTVLRLHPALAPVKVAIFPLMRKDGHPEKAQELVELLRPCCAVMYDHAVSIGRRYRRQDEIGTPLCVTGDHQTMADDTVTLRDRDSMEQQRLPISELLAIVKDKIAPPVPAGQLRP